MNTDLAEKLKTEMGYTTIIGRFCNMKFGDWITFDVTLKRAQENKGDGVYKFWQKIEGGVTPGIFLGYRTLANGYRNYYSEGGFSFTPKAYLRAALVAFSERHNPVLVPLEHIDEKPF